jgi:hypothetical protein
MDMGKPSRRHPSVGVRDRQRTFDRADVRLLDFL